MLSSRNAAVQWTLLKPWLLTHPTATLRVSSTSTTLYDARHLALYLSLLS
jgi:hypothetical protein